MMSVPSGCLYLDVSDLQPPEPMALALEAIGKLEPGCYLQMHHWREPLLLYERLAGRGFAHDARLGPHHSCEIFIWNAKDESAAEAAAKAAGKLPVWRE